MFSQYLKKKRIIILKKMSMRLLIWLEQISSKGLTKTTGQGVNRLKTVTWDRHREIDP